MGLIRLNIHEMCTKKLAAIWTRLCFYHLVILIRLFSERFRLCLVDKLQDPLEDLDRVGLVVEQLKDLETGRLLQNGFLH